MRLRFMRLQYRALCYTERAIAVYRPACYINNVSRIKTVQLIGLHAVHGAEFLGRPHPCETVQRRSRSEILWTKTVYQAPKHGNFCSREERSERVSRERGKAFFLRTRIQCAAETWLETSEKILIPEIPESRMSFLAIHRVHSKTRQKRKCPPIRQVGSMSSCRRVSGRVPNWQSAK